MSDRNSLDDLLKPRSEMVEVERVDELADADRDSGHDYVAYGHGRVSRQPQMMIAFRQCSGHIEVLPYSLLRRITTDDPEREFTMSFGETDLVIRGRGMFQLFRYACEHRAVEIIEADRTEALRDQECVITDISVRRQ